ncbi:MAG: CAP domain-containing protein [Oscillatoriophycideae cyanobacterium NC_groundwater_1537_Pr4_S-0.65um_50_18]|nr:CAP domain-containing protein [Oscillatoriophycideae cyanobacterium NC_groundwater_1537_Pr4_S-0.65um_50_18]
MRQFAIAPLLWAASSLSGFALAQQPAPAPEQTCEGQAIIQAQSCTGDGLESEEERLYQVINNYRAQNNLPAIPLSPSLNRVANRHVRDLAENVGKLTHGWSDCPYTAGDRTTYSCMWAAPQRLNTAYPGSGYENAHASGGDATAQSAFASWQSSSAHNAVILNQGVWQEYPWQAIGIGIYKNYAVIWMGKEADPASEAATPPEATPTEGTATP